MAGLLKGDAPLFVLGVLGAVVALGTGCRSLVGVDGDPAQGEDAGVVAEAGDGSIEAKADAGPADSCCVVDSAVDVVPNDGCPDVPVDAGIDVGLPVECEVTETFPLLAEGVMGGPRMDRTEGGWGVVAIGEEFHSILLNAVRDDGSVVHQANFSLLNGGTYYTPVVAGVGDRLMLGVARPGNSPQPWGADFYSVDPVAGVVAAGPVTVATSGDTVPVVVSGIASAPSLQSVAAVTREAENEGVTGDATLRLLREQPFAQTKEAFVHERVYAADVAWSEETGRFGVAVLDDTALTRGYLHVLDANLEEVDVHEFTGAADRPIVSGGWGVSVAAAGDRFVVVWADGRAGEGQQHIYLASIDGVTGQKVTASSVHVCGSSAILREHTRVRFDGRSIIVAWLEQDGTFLSLRAHRFTPDLKPLGGVLTIDPAGDVLQGPFGVAQAAENDYGFVSIRPDGNMLFARVACTGP
jgi:hypothetical protein